MKIFKYQIPRLGRNEIDLPFGTRVLDVQMKDGAITMWAMVEPASFMAKHRVWVMGTGFDVADMYGRYVGTVQNAGMVWHVFTDAEVMR